MVDSNGRYRTNPTKTTQQPGPNTVVDPKDVTDEYGQHLNRPQDDQFGVPPPPPPPAKETQPWPAATTDVVAQGGGVGTSQRGAAPSPSFPQAGHDPGVKPIAGHDRTLPVAYGDIHIARTCLKALNAEINDVQQDTFNDIAEGMRIKGWLMFGRGVRFIPGVQMIEGRSKEDVRWEELQAGGGKLSNVAWWVLVAMVGVCLGASCEFIGLISKSVFFFPQLDFHLRCQSCSLLGWRMPARRTSQTMFLSCGQWRPRMITTLGSRSAPLWLQHWLGRSSSSSLCGSYTVCDPPSCSHHSVHL